MKFFDMVSRFQNNYWNLFKLLWTALMMASRYSHLEIVKMLLEQKGIDKGAAKNFFTIQFS